MALDDDLIADTLDFQFYFTSVDVTVTRPEPDALPFATQGIWNNTPLDESQPFGQDRSKKDPRRVMFFRRSSSQPEIVRGSIVLAAERGRAAVKWRVDGFERGVEPDLIRAVLLPAVEVR